MATFEVDFIFCCPCFVTDIFDLRFHKINKYFLTLFIEEIEERRLTWTIFWVNRPCLLFFSFGRCNAL